MTVRILALDYWALAEQENNSAVPKVRVRSEVKAGANGPRTHKSGRDSQSGPIFGRDASATGEIVISGGDKEPGRFTGFVLCLFGLLFGFLGLG